MSETRQDHDNRNDRNDRSTRAARTAQDPREEARDAPDDDRLRTDGAAPAGISRRRLIGTASAAGATGLALGAVG
ncbi:hypothetical protein GT002_14455, partial [Streptomyces sp. SID4917]